VISVGRYRVLRRLGQGGMAEVFEAVAEGAEGFRRRVAIKRVLPEHATDASVRRMFFDEARIAARLHHPGIVAVLDFGLDGDAPFQVLELVDGEDLAAVLRRVGTLPLGVALHVGREVANALDCAHRATDDEGRPLGIVHRDVSPSNVLVSREGDVKLGDFGIAFAHERSERTAAGVVRGKPAYMAPEQLTGGVVDARTDVFGLACTLHRALVGRSPLADEDAIARLLRGERVALDASIPADVGQVLGHALAPSRADRPRDAAELARAFDELTRRHLEVDGRSALRSLLAPSLPADPLGSLFELAWVVEGEAGGGSAVVEGEAGGGSAGPLQAEAPRRFERTTRRAIPKDEVDATVAKEVSAGSAARSAWRSLGAGASVVVAIVALGAWGWSRRGSDESSVARPAAETETTSETGTEARTEARPEARTETTAATETTDPETGTEAESEDGTESAMATEAAMETALGGATDATNATTTARRSATRSRSPTRRNEEDAQLARASHASREPAFLRIGGEGALGAEIRVEGVSRGFAPTTVELPVGTHVVELVRRDGSRSRHPVVLDVRDGPTTPQRLIVR
jgi:tRNA A-37 threonylcarbamoyl transferase component Bud32